MATNTQKSPPTHLHKRNIFCGVEKFRSEAEIVFEIDNIHAKIEAAEKTEGHSDVRSFTYGLNYHHNQDEKAEKETAVVQILHEQTEGRLRSANLHAKLSEHYIKLLSSAAEGFDCRSLLFKDSSQTCGHGWHEHCCSRVSCLY